MKYLKENREYPKEDWNYPKENRKYPKENRIYPKENGKYPVEFLRVTSARPLWKISGVGPLTGTLSDGYKKRLDDSSLYVTLEYWTTANWEYWEY